MYKWLTIMSVLLLTITHAMAQNGTRGEILDKLYAKTRTENPEFTEFSAQRGQRLFTTRFSTGKPKTPACTSCHGDTPAATGKTRAGKIIKPMAVSLNQNRYTDTKKVNKWFRRNCKSVLGRTCTAKEKGDFITFMISQ